MSGLSGQSYQKKTLPKHRRIILNSMTQTREKWDSHVFSRLDIYMVWTCHIIPWVQFYFFCLELKGYLDESDFGLLIFDLDDSATLKVTLIELMFKVPSQQLLGTLTITFWRKPYNWRFFGHGWGCVLILSSRLDKTSRN